MLPKNIHPLSSFFHKLMRVFLTASLAISGLAAALPQPAQAAPDSPTGYVGDMGTARVRHTATLLHNGKVLVLGGENDTGLLGSAELYNMTTGTWSATGGVSPARESHTATMLLNGKVLVVGGADDNGALFYTALYDPANGTWTAAADLETARSNHTATLLEDGSVLVVGGEDIDYNPIETAERYNPATNTWSAAGTLNEARMNHTATLLPGGWVMVTGGDGGEVLDTTELYNPTGNAWLPVDAHMSTNRLGHSATALPLPNGKVLIAGGDNNDGVLDSAELFTFNPAVPGSSTWTDAGSMAVNSHTGHSATLLPNGKVMVAGGFGDEGGVLQPLGSIEMYDPASDAWAGVGNLATPRRWPTATLLPTGEVLLAGGINGSDYHASVEKIDLTTGDWTATSDMTTERSGHSATLLADGKVLVAGGTDQSGMLTKVEIYDPATGSWSNALDMNTARANHTATLLPNGKLLVAGGGTGTIFTTEAELYDPDTGEWRAISAMHEARANHTATLLRNGQVLVVGGLTNDSHYLTGAEMYNPDTGIWTLMAPLNNARKDHTATLLTDGTLLVTGGFSTEGTEVGFLSSSERYNLGLNEWQTTGAMGAVRGNHTATLLPNGQVLVAGGLNADLFPPKTSELYDPLSGSWASAGLMSYAHYFHSARLLPNGKVLVVGGVDETGPIAICEVYDPIIADWQTVNPMSSPRMSFTTTILANGEILAAGGQNINQLKSAELYNVGQGFLPAWRPTITSFPTRLKTGQMLTLSGTNFRGFQQISTSSGATHESPSNYPLVQLRRPDNGQVAWLSPDPKLGFSETVFHSIPLGFAIGPVIITVYVNGIPSQSVMIQIEAFRTFTPMLFRADPRPFKVRLPLLQR